MKYLKSLAVVLALSFPMMSSTAYALGPGDAHTGTGRDNGLGHDNHQGNGYGHHKGDSVPELDPNAAGAALILLVGGTLVLLERRR